MEKIFFTKRNTKQAEIKITRTIFSPKLVETRKKSWKLGTRKRENEKEIAWIRLNTYRESIDYRYDTIRYDTSRRVAYSYILILILFERVHFYRTAVSVT